jgi:ubiquitin carboxyl-terminal hydrolase 2/21
MNIDRYKNKGIAGLINLGNTCFINATLHPLFHTYELTELLHSKLYINKINKVPETLLLIEWENISRLMLNNRPINPKKFVSLVYKISSIKNQSFTGQQDLSEFFIFLIECFHKALTRSVNMTINGDIINETDIIASKCFKAIKEMYEKDYSEIWKLFYGVQVTNIENIDTNEKITIVPEPFSILNLSIPKDNKEPSLEDCLDLYVETEILTDDNRLKKENGEYINSSRQIMFWSFPDILVIDIKRFDSNNKKKQMLVTFPFILDLSKYVIGYNKHLFVYDLYAVCNHSGSSLGGHYTSFVKNANGHWYHYNDISVQRVHDPSKIITSKAYCFFYRKQK